ncbi:hypothetical protein Leryth_013080 [Lithospermum erythrorhizon]|nr:hypothetical protein Leryth_013080 [Lithospermum erythrorhizon]
MKTTGMDPIAKRHVWDIILAAKQGRCIILTTHAMEEADILSDRVGIMAKGTLRCVGTSLLLKQKFGAGFIVKVNFIGDHTPEQDHDTKLKHEDVKDFFKQVTFDPIFIILPSPISKNDALF